MLVVDNLGRSFGSKEVVRSLDLSVEPGERVALTGPNGSGKSTVLRCIVGLLAPTRGSIAIDGHLAGTLDARRRIGAALSQERSFYLRLTGHANLLFFARFRYPRKADAERAVGVLEEELELGEIAANRADACSTGMIQQLGLARALLGDPSVVVLDEPTRSLDTAAVGRLWGALERRSNLAVVMATHRASDLDHCGTRVSLPR